MQLFNRDGNGAAEIVRAIGLIANGIDFSKWEPILPLGVRDVVAIIGPTPVLKLSQYYIDGPELESDESPDDMDAALAYLQQAVALFTWLRVIPTLDAQHDEGGRSRRLGENEKGLTALQEYKDEANILRMAYEAVDALIDTMTAGELPFWLLSAKYAQRENLLLRSREQFDEFYFIGSSRLYVTLLPLIREVQECEVEPIIGRKRMVECLNYPTPRPAMRETAARAVALLTMKKAVERLPVQVIPEGVVQVQQSQPVNSKLRAEQSARQSVAASLGNDAARLLSRLQMMVAAEDETPEASGSYTPGPIAHSKGMTF